LVAAWLRDRGYDVFSVYEQARGISDDEVLARAVQDDRILITNDKDFGETIVRLGRPHRGILLLRLEDERAANKIAKIAQVMREYPERLSGCLVVVTERAIRFSGPRPGAEL
jgi:predicted nuclease of predicted toxin-antitoxin system